MIDKVHYDIITPRLINMLHEVKNIVWDLLLDKLRGKKLVYVFRDDSIGLDSGYLYG